MKQFPDDRFPEADHEFSVGQDQRGEGTAGIEAPQNIHEASACRISKIIDINQRMNDAIVFQELLEMDAMAARMERVHHRDTAIAG